MHAYSIPLGYVHNFFHCSFLICIGFHAHMFNSHRICARILYFDLLDYFLDERSTRDAKELTRKYTSIEKCFGDDSDLP